MRIPNGMPSDCPLARLESRDIGFSPFLIHFSSLFHRFFATSGADPDSFEWNSEGHRAIEFEGEIYAKNIYVYDYCVGVGDRRGEI